MTEETANFLIELAYRSIRSGLASGAAGEAETAGSPAEALVNRACFVTLTTEEERLRGCRGRLEAHRSLAADVWHNAWASAFDDPRFAPVSAAEFHRLRVEISVLGPLESVPVSTEDELTSVLLPHRDGVVLSWRGRRATFLPQVWEDVPDPREFLGHLKLKAGLPVNFWAPDVEVRRYQVEKLCGRAGQRLN